MQANTSDARLLWGDPRTTDPPSQVREHRRVLSPGFPKGRVCTPTELHGLVWELARVKEMFLQKEELAKKALWHIDYWRVSDVGESQEVEQQQYFFLSSKSIRK